MYPLTPINLYMLDSVRDDPLCLARMDRILGAIGRGRDDVLAGRCISADRSALASLRVMPTCMYLGEAAGTAAALAVSEGVPPHRVDAKEVRRRTINT